VTHDPDAASSDRVVRFHRRAPKHVHLITYWQIESARTGRMLTCAGYRSPAGLELCVQYSDDEIIETMRFRDPNAWTQMNAYAEAARKAFAAAGVGRDT
jgi:hypothetical protein